MVRSFKMEVGGTGKTGWEAVGFAGGDPPGLSADLAVDGHVGDSS